MGVKEDADKAESVLNQLDATTRVKVREDGAELFIDLKGHDRTVMNTLHTYNFIPHDVAPISSSEAADTYVYARHESDTSFENSLPEPELDSVEDFKEYLEYEGILWDEDDFEHVNGSDYRISHSGGWFGGQARNMDSSDGVEIMNIDSDGSGVEIGLRDVRDE